MCACDRHLLLLDKVPKSELCWYTQVIKNHFASEYIYNKYKDLKTCDIIEDNPQVSCAHSTQAKECAEQHGEW